MINIKVDIDDSRLLKLKTLGLTMSKEVNEGIKLAAFLVQGVIKKKISQGGRGGTKYSVGGKGAQRSAPWEPPKTDTGRLVNSIRPSFEFLHAEVGSDVKYATFLEEGTSRMEPRPFLKPSLDESAKEIMELIDASIERALKK